MKDVVEDMSNIYTNLLQFMNKPHFIVFDTETTGLPIMHCSAKKALYAYDGARLLQLSWCVYDKDNNLIKCEDHYVKPIGYRVSATHIHRITNEMAQQGEKYEDVIALFINDLKTVNYIIGHNVFFDINILTSEMLRHHQIEYINILDQKTHICTACISKRLYGRKLHQYELYERILQTPMLNAHNSKYDTLNLGKIVVQLRIRKLLLLDHHEYNQQIPV